MTPQSCLYCTDGSVQIYADRTRVPRCSECASEYRVTFKPILDCPDCGCNLANKFMNLRDCPECGSIYKYYQQRENQLERLDGDEIEETKEWLSSILNAAKQKK